MIAKSAVSVSAAEDNNQQEECYYLCFSRADRIVTVVDDYGEFITEIHLCAKCHEILDKGFKKFKWRYININTNTNININNIHPPSFDVHYHRKGVE